MSEIRIREQSLKQAVSDDENSYDDRSKLIGHTCTDEDDIKSLILDDDSLTIDQITDKIAIGFFHYLIIIVGGMCYSGYYIMILAYGLINVTACDLDINTGNKSWLTVAFSIGTVIGSSILGPLGDIIGRRIVLVTSLAFCLVFFVASAFAYNYIMLVIVACLNGFSIGGSFCNVHAYSIEFFPRSYRGRGLLCISGFLTLGSIYACGIALVILPLSISVPIGSIYFTSWRLYLLVCAIPGFLAFCVLLYLPKSIRFIIKNGDEDQFSQALAVIDRINSCCQRKPDSCMSAVPVHRFFTAVDKEKMLKETKPKYNYISSLRKFTQPPWNKRAALLTTVWVGCCFGISGLWIWIPSIISY